MHKKLQQIHQSFFLRVKKYNMYVCMSVCMHKVTMYKTGAEVKGHCTLAHSSSNLSQRTEKEMKWWSSLVPRPLPDFISQPWKKNWEKAWDHKYVTERKWWTRFVLTESTISSPWHSFDPRPSPDFSHGCEIKSGSGLGTRLVMKIFSPIPMHASWWHSRSLDTRQTQALPMQLKRAGSQRSKVKMRPIIRNILL